MKTEQEAAEPATGRRTIGDILLARGFVDEKQLGTAIATQERTGQPLGQILVEAGVITRLELASALAEQWSDSPSLPGLTGDGGSESAWAPVPATAAAVASADDERRRWLDEQAILDRITAVETALRHIRERDGGGGAQLHEALVELARQVEGTVTSETLDERVREVVTRVEAVEPAIAETSAALDELTSAVEQAFAEMQKGSAGLAEDLASLVGRVESALDERPLVQLQGEVEELEERVATLADTAILDGLREEIDELARRPVADPALADQLQELASRVEGLPSAADLEELRASIGDVADRPPGDPAIAARLDELASQVTALGERPVSDPLLAQRVEAALARIEELDAVHATLTDVQSTVAELAARPITDAAIVMRVEELAACVAALEEARNTPKTQTKGVDPVDLAKLRTAVAELEARGDGNVDLTPLYERLDDLEQRIAAAVDASVNGPAQALAELRATVQELSSRAEAPLQETAALRAELEDAERRMVARLEELAVPQAAVEFPPAANTGAPHDDVAALRTDIEEQIARIGQTTDDLAQRVSRAIDSWMSDTAGLSARLDEIASRVEETRAPIASARPDVDVPTSREPTGSGVEQDIERLRMSVERIGLNIGEQGRAIAELMRARQVGAQIEELTSRLRDLEARGVGQISGGASEGAEPGDSLELRGDLRVLARKLEEAEEFVRSDREKLLSRLERMASAIEWRFQRLESDNVNGAAQP